MVSRTLEGTLGKGQKRVTVKQIHQFIKVKGDDEKAIQLDTKIQDMNKQTLYLFGASQEIIRYVLFCHQDESNWLFAQNKDLKKIFDRIFDTEKFSKMMAKMISLKKAYKLRQIQVRIECNANRDKFEAMIGSMKEMQRNIKSLKTNLIELQKEKEARKSLQNQKKEATELALDDGTIGTENTQNPENLKIQLETKLEYHKIQEDEYLNDVNYRKESIQQNEHLGYSLDELEVKIKPYTDKIDSYESMNSQKMKEIQEINKKIHSLDIGDTEDAQILKQKVNIVKNQILELMGQENTLPINVVLEEAKKHLENLIESNASFNDQTKAILKPWEDKIQKEELKKLQCEASQKRLQTLLSSLEDKEIAKQNIYNTKDKLDKQIKLLDKINDKFAAKQAEIKKVSTQISDASSQMKTNEKKIQNCEQQKLAIEYARLKKEMEKMYQLLMNALETENLEVVKKVDAMEIEKTISNARESLRVKEESLKSKEFTEIAAETNIGHWKEEINKLRNEIVTIEIDITKLDKTLNTGDQLKVKYKELKAKKKVLMDDLAIMIYIGEGENIKDLQKLSEQKSICKVCFKPYTSDDHKKAQSTFAHQLQTRQAKGQAQLKIDQYKQELETVDAQLKKLLPHKMNLSTIDEKEKRIEELTKKIEKEYKMVNGMQKEKIKLENKVKMLRTQIKNCEDVQNMVINRTTNELRMAEIEKTVDVSVIIGVNYKQREDYLKNLKKDQMYISERWKSLVENQQLLNKQLDDLRLQRGDIILEKKQIEQNLERLKATMLDPSVKSENGTGSQLYTESKIKEEYEEHKDQITTCDFNIDELKQKQTEIEAEREKEYSRKREEKVLFEDKIQTLELNYQKLMGSNPEDQIKIKQALNEYSKYQTQIQKLNSEITQNNESLKKTKEQMKSLQECISFKRSEFELMKTQKLIADYKTQLRKVTKLVNKQDIINRKLDENQQNLFKHSAEYSAVQKSAVNAYNSMKKRRVAEVDYFNSLAELEYIKDQIEEIELFMTGLEESLQIYHEEKIEEVNNNIKAIWDECYKGKDITRIELKTKPENENGPGGKKKNFDYRVVFYQNEVMLDMRGRSSAGQRVLASIVIRIALAETFANNTGVMALDEPTTNLDKEHIELLSQFLGNMINARKDNDDFQLIIITHDQQFISMLKEHCSTYYQVFKPEGGFSQVREKAMSDLKIINN